MRQEITAYKTTKNKNIFQIDFNLFILICLMLFFGALMIFSASYPYGKAHNADAFYYIKRHLVFLAIGIIVMLFISRINLRIVQKITPFFYAFCILLLILVLFGGFSEGVAKRWIGIPNTPLSFQPSELAKLAIILMLSRYLSKSQVVKKSFMKEIIIPGLIIFIPCLLVMLEKHLSGTLIIAMIGISILFISGINLKRAICFYGGLGTVGTVAFLLTNSYALKRIESFFNPNADILSDKWQTTQGLYAVGSGGLFGLGYFNSRQKYSYVSEPQNDFIFTIWCEEMGYIGAILLLVGFLLLIWKGYRIAFSQDNLFKSLVAFGISTQIGIQSFLNMFVVLDLIPNTGISLPFFSYGGSSLVILLAEMGILLSISRESRK